MLAHYLPRCYLDAFTLNERLFVFDRDTRKLRRDSSQNVAAITDYYIVTNHAGERDESVEHGLLANIESAASPVLRRLANGEAISDEEHDVAATFIAFLCTRIPAFEATYAELNNQMGQETFRRAARTPEKAAASLAAHPKSFPYSISQFRDFVNSGELVFMPDKAERIRLMIDAAEPLIEGFKSMDWWLLCARGRRRFITSDAPLGFLPLPGAFPTYGELSPNILRFLAISPDSCLMLADRQKELPFLAVKEMDDDGVREVNAAIALGAVRLIVARDRHELEAVLDETSLRNSSFKPRTTIVNWEDAVEERSFGLNIRIHHNTEFPLQLPISWTCVPCGKSSSEVFVVSSDLSPARPQAYTDWLDRPCTHCGRRPRETRSTLGGEDLLELTFPPDVV